MTESMAMPVHSAPPLPPLGPDPDMVEVSMLLPRWQLIGLESAAKQRGMSAGQLLRRLIATVLEQRPTPVAV